MQLLRELKHHTSKLYRITSLRLLLGTEAPVMTPNGIDFPFFFFLHAHYLATLWINISTFRSKSCMPITS